MGCASSKGVVVAEDVYRPPPTSIALFDINSIHEPWLMKNVETDVEEEDEEEVKKKPMHIPLPLLEKLESSELTPQYTWSEVSKALEDLKPSLHKQNPKSPPTTTTTTTAAVKEQPQPPSSPARLPPPEISGLQPVRKNSFLIRDREEREKNSNNPRPWRRQDPLEGYPERCPPGARPGSVVLYTTTLGGVRRTYEDCDRVRKVVEVVAEDAGTEVDERDVSLHGEFLKEVRELVGEGAAVVPRLFMMGRYIGGAEEVAELNETGKLKEMMRWTASRGGRREGSRRDCEGCGAARFVPCLDCGGSCKVVGEDGKEVVRCSKCNENGLVLCPLCH